MAISCPFSALEGRKTTPKMPIWCQVCPALRSSVQEKCPAEIRSTYVRFEHYPNVRSCSFEQINAYERMVPQAGLPDSLPQPAPS